MEELFTVLSYSLGATFSMRRIRFLTAVQKQNKTDLLFGSMGLGLAFLLLPREAFILNDQGIYPGKTEAMFNCLKLNHLDTDL